MTIRYPFSFVTTDYVTIFGRLVENPRWYYVRRDFNRGATWWAPWGLAHVYRFLPYMFRYTNSRHANQRMEGAYFLWSVTAPLWRVGWLPSRRSVTGRTHLFVAIGKREWTFPRRKLAVQPPPVVEAKAPMS